MKLLALITLSVSTTVFCKPSFEIESYAAQIIGGSNTQPRQVPFQAWLTLTGPDGSVVCGGSLISNKYVLTAGHCTNGRSSGTVLLGAYNLSNTAEPTRKLIKIKRCITHPNFNFNTLTSDIGLIEMTTTVSETAAIKIGVLPTRADISTTYVGQTGTVSGWGLTSVNGSDAEILQYENDTIISNAECARYFGNSVRIYNICLSATSGRRTCNGDSGGPMTVAKIIIGVVSYGVQFCVSGAPSVFTRTANFLTWIQQNSDVVIR